MAFTVEIMPSALEELKSIKVFVTVEEFRAHVDRYLDAAAQGDVVLTRGGRPIAVVQAVPKNGDQDTDPFVGSEEFWRMIRQRRQERGIPWEEARKQLDLND